MNEYLEFLERKKHSASSFGIGPTYIPPNAFDYQKYAIEYVVKKGRCAVYFDTGLGKTVSRLPAGF